MEHTLTKEEKKNIDKIHGLFNELDAPLVLALTLSTIHMIGRNLKKEKYEDFKKLVLKVLKNIENENLEKDID